MRFLLYGACIPVVVFAVIWLLDRAAGTGWALPVAALVCLPILVVTFRREPL